MHNLTNNLLPTDWSNLPSYFDSNTERLSVCIAIDSESESVAPTFQENHELAISDHALTVNCVAR